MEYMRLKGMKYMRKKSRYNWRDHKTKTQIPEELHITPILEEIKD
jgi:hypothetical protein